MQTAKKLKAPFAYFGGKSRAADIVWQRFGDVPNYIEPFAGSLAVMLARPHAPRTETVNDVNGYLVNFWRSVKHQPEAVAYYADNPVFELDLHARHRWLRHEGAAIVEKLREDPYFYDAKVAGWWVWTASLLIGGWREEEVKGIPSPFPYGVKGISVRNNLPVTMCELSARLKNVSIACGDWKRIIGDSFTVNWNSAPTLTAVFLDPPYDGFADLYGSEFSTAAVREWAIANGDNPLFRIALCGYECEHEMPESWVCVAWKSNGGYSNQRKDKSNDNKHKERIWFSPHCLKPRQGSLFEEEA